MSWSLIRAVAVCVVLAGCGSAQAEGMNDADGMQEEYRAELARLEFPPDYSPAAEAAEGESGASYQSGLGRGAAGFQWLCAWSQEWISQRALDSERADHALDVLDTFPELDLWNNMDNTGRQTILAAVDEARLNDPSGIQQQVEAIGC